MSTLATGDLARSYQLTRLTTGLKNSLTRLNKELTTGVKSDISSTVSGDFAPIANIERSLATFAARKTATTEAANLTAGMQSALGMVQDTGQALLPALLSASTLHDQASIETIAMDAKERFGSVVSALNTEFAGRSLFAGAAYDRPPFASDETILAELKLAVAGETTAAGVATAVDSWFDTPGGGFDTLAYLGSDNPIGPLFLGDDESLNLDIRGDDAAIRSHLKSFALAALVAEDVPPGAFDEQAALVALAGRRMVASDDELTVLRADVGAIEARIETASVRSQAEQTALELARNELIATNPYETATELEAVYNQLETLYTVTAHLADLKFTDFMR